MGNNNASAANSNDKNIKLNAVGLCRDVKNFIIDDGTIDMI